MNLLWLMMAVLVLSRPPAEHTSTIVGAHGDATYDVYSFLVADQLTKLPPEARVYISDTTTAAPSSICLKLDLTKRNSMYDRPIAPYYAANRKSQRLQARFDLRRPYELASRRTLKELLQASGDQSQPWIVFSVSGVGFNANYDRAVVYVSYVCGELCGQGTIAFLVKEGGKWTYDQQADSKSCTWVS
jgi:hypothetical protein